LTRGQVATVTTGLTPATGPEWFNAVMDYPHSVSTGLVALFVLASAVWVGGLVALKIVATATRDLPAPDRVRVFRGIGRLYGPIGSAALLVALATGLALSRNEPRDGLFAATVAAAAALVVVSVVGMVQARAMTRLRRRALAAPTDPALRARVVHGGRRAAALRLLIAVLTLALVLLGAALAT
jgi:uncharacterized membrane protein